MADDHDQRLALNEALFRDVNEAIQSGKTPADMGSRASFRCECGQLGCNDLIELTVGAYERVRSNPRRFFVTPGHEQAVDESVVETHPGYVVVEKREQAGQTAERTDPRS